MVFIPNPDNLPEINHKNGIKNDNRIENLEWVTKIKNQLHASYVLGKRIGADCCAAKLDNKQVLEIYELCKENRLLRKDIADMYNVDSTSVSGIVMGRSWKHLNLRPLESMRGKKRNGSTYKKNSGIN